MFQYLSLQKSIRYNEGEMICFNNKRMAHGRNAFDNTAKGSRHLQVYMFKEFVVIDLRIVMGKIRYSIE